MATLFRNAVIDAMPQAVKSRLEDVVGLNTKTHTDFCDHVSHAVEQHRKNEQKLKTQEKELQRKITQLQLEELTKKEQGKDSSSNKERRIRTNDIDVTSKCSSTSYTAKPTRSSPSKCTPDPCIHL